MKKENRYMRNSHNNVNESGTQVQPNRSNVQIAHMDAKPLLMMVMIFFFMLLFLGLGGFFILQSQVQDLNLKLVKMESSKAIPYMVHHDLSE